jgi:hypothetical protein
MKMMTSKYPVLSVMFQLVTVETEFEAFRNDARDYLKARGVAPGSDAHEALAGVSHNEQASHETIRTVVQCILDETSNETNSSGQGPQATEPQKPAPLLSAFHAKFVNGQDIPWGSRPTIEDELVAEIKGKNLIW